jgi:membrane protease YdiL (CAAX protease family)
MEPPGTPAVVATDESAARIAPIPSQPEIFRPIASYWHTALVLGVQCLLVFRGKTRMAHLSLGSVNRPAIYERTMFFEWALLGVVLVGVWWHGSSLLAVLGERWRSTQQLLRDLGIGLLFLIATIATGSLLGHGGDNSATQLLLPHGSTEMWLWVALSISAGICEEALFRGYLQRQFIAITGNVAVGILLSAATFGAAHGYQGWARALQIALLGAMGGALAHWCKSVRPGMFAHALQDILGGMMRH